MNKRAAALHRLNMRRTNVAVKAAFFTIVLENHGSVILPDGGMAEARSGIMNEG